jgi:hypothetical protein
MTTTILLAALLAAAQDSTDQTMTIRLDDKGDAQITIDFQLSAKAWLNWRQTYGDHPDLLRRDLTHRFSMFSISDFNLVKDDTNRKATASITSKGEARYRGDGRFELQLPKTWRKVTDTGREWHFAYSEVVGQNATLNQTIKIVLPEGATGARLEPESQGQQLLKYETPVRRGGGGGGGMWAALFFASLLGALALTGVRFTVWKSVP